MNVVSVICEGSSEVNYIVRLKAYLAELDLAWMMDTLLIPINAGSGNFHVIDQRIRAERKRQRHGNFMTWVDYDIYRRNDNRCLDAYLRRRKNLGAFYFSFHNFEDFLALHFDDVRYGRYCEVVAKAGHVDMPLHGAEYGGLFDPIYLDFTGEPYRKGMLSYGFVGKEGLENLIRHMKNRAIGPVGESEYGDFAMWLVEFLERHSPKE